jgi:hypothetical protein
MRIARGSPNAEPGTQATPLASSSAAQKSTSLLDRVAVVALAERHRDIRERVERALRTRAHHTGNRFQRIDHDVALLGKFRTSPADILRAAERRDAAAVITSGTLVM